MEVNVPYNLKHFHRRPINFLRLTQRTKLQIIKKHPAITQLKLLETCKACKFVVGMVYAEMSCLQTSMRFLERFPKSGLLSEEDRPKCFPLKETDGFHEWAWNFMFLMTNNGPNQIARDFKENFEQAPYTFKKKENPTLTQKWKQEQAYGPSEFNLKEEKIDSNTMQKIIIKASPVVVTRLARTSSFGKEAAFQCFKKLRLLEMIENPFLKDKLVIKGNNYYTDSIWKVTTIEISSQLYFASKVEGKEPEETAKKDFEKGMKNSVKEKEEIEKKKQEFGALGYRMSAKKVEYCKP